MRPLTKISILFIAASTLLIFLFILLILTEPLSALRANIESLIRKELIYIDHLPSKTTVDAIYLLGGNQKSLKFKFKKAAYLYQNSTCGKIMILSRPGKTEYNNKLGRNLTNDEWSILQLQRCGIPQQNIEPITMKEGFFGTLSEAKCIAKLIKERRYNTLILITSPHHTHRVKISFEKFLENHDVTSYVQASDRKTSLKGLIIEFIKLKVYQYMLVSSEQ
jgi:uncharacterized SAM-binding protein YcdF (DUF218 family)